LGRVAVFGLVNIDRNPVTPLYPLYEIESLVKVVKCVNEDKSGRRLSELGEHIDRNKAGESKSRRLIQIWKMLDCP